MNVLVMERTASEGPKSPKNPKKPENKSCKFGGIMV